MASLDNDTLDTMNQLTDPKPSSPSLDDPTLNTLSDDDLGTVDWDAPESRSGGYTPQVYPGNYPFLFSLEDKDPFEVRQYDTKDGEHIKEFTVNHKATVSYPGEDGTPKEATIRFNQAGFRRSPKMVEKRMNSRGGELLRSLGIHPPSMSKEVVEQALREADGRTMGRGVVNWDAYCKACKDAGSVDNKTWSGTVSTSPNSKRGDARWPKGTDGKYVTEVACPKCGAALAGREKITGYLLPQA